MFGSCWRNAFSESPFGKEGNARHGVVDQSVGGASDIFFEHPMGFMNVKLDYHENGVNSVIRSAKVIRTARKLSSGLIYIPSSIWSV